MNMPTSSGKIKAYGFFPNRFETKETNMNSSAQVICNKKEKETSNQTQNMKSFLNNKNKI